MQCFIWWRNLFNGDYSRNITSVSHDEDLITLITNYLVTRWIPPLPVFLSTSSLLLALPCLWHIPHVNSTNGGAVRQSNFMWVKMSQLTTKIGVRSSLQISNCSHLSNPPWTKLVSKLIFSSLKRYVTKTTLGCSISDPAPCCRSWASSRGWLRSLAG